VDLTGGEAAEEYRRREMAEQSVLETIKGTGQDLVDEIERLVHEGNVRRVVVKHGAETVAEFPLTVGVVGALLAPVLVAVGALVGALSHCTVEIERLETTPTDTRADTDQAAQAQRSNTARGVMTPN
jgi:hypothetical protein